MVEPPSPASRTRLIQHEPGVPVIRSINWAGMRALYQKEVRRFLKVQLQTVWAPALTTLLLLLVFTLALGRGGVTVMGAPFADFIAPGLIMMGMIQNAYQNASFSLLVGKMQGTIVDYLMPPVSPGELLVALVASSMTRAILVGFAIWLAMALWPGVHVTPAHVWAVLWFGLMGSALLSFVGLLTSIWAEKFDHAAAIGNFVVAPFSLLSGTFYSMDRVAPLFGTISHANPFFWTISGFRYGFLGASDSHVMFGALALLALNAGLCLLCYVALARGWKIKA
jgi:ABC-2 type transport system permease protein